MILTFKWGNAGKWKIFQPLSTFMSPCSKERESEKARETKSRKEPLSTLLWVWWLSNLKWLSALINGLINCISSQEHVPTVNASNKRLYIKLVQIQWHLLKHSYNMLTYRLYCHFYLSLTQGSLIWNTDIFDDLFLSQISLASNLNLSWNVKISLASSREPSPQHKYLRALFLQFHMELQNKEE